MNKYYVLALQELANSRREDRENDHAIWAGEMEGGENIYPEVSYEVSCVTRLKNWKNTNRTGYSHDTVWWMFLFRVSGQVNLNFSGLDPPANATVHLGDVASRFLLSRVDLPTSKWRAQSTVLPDLKDSHLCLLRQSEFTCRSPKLTTCCIQGFCCFFFFFNRVSNVLDDSAVNCGLTLHLSGFISCVFGSGILSPAIVVIETICVSSESPLNPWLLSGLGMCV